MNKISKFITVSILGTLVVGTTACSDFLTENPQTALTESQIMANLDYAELNLQSIYTTWRNNCFKDQQYWELLIATDEVQSGALQALKSGSSRAAMETFDASLNSQNSYTCETWNNRWPIVTAAGKIIAALDNDGVNTDEQQKQIFGEARFIRGSVYYQLAMIYGRLPIIDIAKASEYGYGRKSMTETWQFIIDDLLSASENCPTSNSAGRATCYAALTMLGKAYMSAPEETGLRDFSKALSCFEKVINSGKYSLATSFGDLFDYTKGNTVESIFEFQFNNTWPDNNQIQFQIGSRAASNFFGDKCYFTGYDHAVPTKYAYTYKSEGGLWDEGDSRYDETLRTDFTWFTGVTPTLEGLEWESLGDDYDELLPHIKKYEDFRTDLYSGNGVNNMWNSGKNIPWLRYADVLLLYAECKNELGNTAEAMDYINNTVRARAFDWNLPADKRLSASGKEDGLNVILDERMRELHAEQWRRFDLVRTGKYASLVKERNEWAKRYATIKDYNIYWPIPLTEIEQNEDMDSSDQNEGYK